MLWLPYVKAAGHLLGLLAGPGATARDGSFE